jgi:hypothetical protein
MRRYAVFLFGLWKNLRILIKIYTFASAVSCAFCHAWQTAWATLPVNEDQLYDSKKRGMVKNVDETS